MTIDANILLGRCLEKLQIIQSSRKGSIGSIHNVYCPQLSREHIDDLVDDVVDYISSVAGDGG